MKVQSFLRVLFLAIAISFLVFLGSYLAWAQSVAHIDVARGEVKIVPERVLQTRLNGDQFIELFEGDKVKTEIGLAIIIYKRTVNCPPGRNGVVILGSGNKHIIEYALRVKECTPTDEEGMARALIQVQGHGGGEQRITLVAEGKSDGNTEQFNSILQQNGLQRGTVNIPRRQSSPSMGGIVSSGTSWNLSEYRQPYAYSLPPGKSPNDIVGMAIAGSNDHVYVWYRDGTVSSGTSSNLEQYRKLYAYSLPPGKSPDDIVGMGSAGSNDHVYAWYRDGTVSSGTSSNLEQYRKLYPYSLPPGKSPDDIVGIAIAGSNDYVYAWYRDGTISSGTSSNLEQYRQPYAYSLPSGKSPDDIVGMGSAGSNDHVYVWYR